MRWDLTCGVKCGAAHSDLLNIVDSIVSTMFYQEVLPTGYLFSLIFLERKKLARHILESVVAEFRSVPRGSVRQKVAHVH